MKKDVNHFVVYAVNHIVMDELQELSHLVSEYSFSRHGVVDSHTGELEPEQILHEDIVIHRHLKGRSEYSSYAINGTVDPVIFLLQLDEKQVCI